MPSKYPWQRQPTASGSTPASASIASPSNPYANAFSNSQSANTRPIAGGVSATTTSRAPNSPAAGLVADSPSQLRARVNSPHNRVAPDVFSNDNRQYPSPSAPGGRGGGNAGKRAVSFLRRKKKDEDDPTGRGGGGGWTQLADDSPGPIVGGVKRYDARGYPARDSPGPAGYGSPARLSPESSKSLRTYNLRSSRSHDSLASEVSSTGAGVNEEAGRFLSTSNNRPTSYYASPGAGVGASVGGTAGASYPPAGVMDYSLSAASYNPTAVSHDSNGYGNGTGYTWRSGQANGNGDSNGYHSSTEPAPSLYAQSMMSVQTRASDSSLTHFKKHDHIQDSYGAFSISSKGGTKHLGNAFSLPADPASWSYLGPEADDDFHDPDIKPNRQTRFLSAMITVRGASNLGCLLLLLLILVGMFGVYPILSQFIPKLESTYGAYNLGGINATGQIPDIGPFQLIDRDTPQSAYTHTSIETGEPWELVFSDEFNRDGRTFWPGDDPYWEAVDLHYWQTNNKEWYHPEMVTTKGGSLHVTLDNTPTNGLAYRGGMIQTWNRFCFTNGYVEAAVSLPGKSNIYGLWPAIWSLGNLGRAGYGGSLEGLWPYSYDTCDVGTLRNQSLNGQPRIPAAQGDRNNGGALSYLPGQRLSSCTCPTDETHPGPKRADGTFVGRGAPEIDMFEAVVDSNTLRGEVSLSGQWAPFNPGYQFINTTANYRIYNATETYLNPWLGSVWQQATTALGVTDQNCYTDETGCFSIYGFEYTRGSTGYISWVNRGRPAWTVRGAAMGPNAQAGVGQRPVPMEPLYLLINLGISENFGPVDYEGLRPLFPVSMEVDYIRVYQDPKDRNIGCDPSDYPTASYIKRYPEIYNNKNITVMDQIPNFVKPKNRLIDTC